jgi:uncharacterized membrane protein YgdD (TMEM256/DUF423 family)
MRFKIRLAALLGAVGVVLGAMGAHGAVHEKLQTTGGAEHWGTAGDYHLLHAVALLVMALLAEKSKALRVGWWCMCAGIFIFSGTLYVLALTQMKWLGHTHRRAGPHRGLAADCAGRGWGDRGSGCYQVVAAPVLDGHLCE